MSGPLLQVKDISKYYRVKKNFWSAPQFVKALNGVSFDLEQGQTLALVGESGCGKSTLAKVLMNIEAPTEGTFNLSGKSGTSMSAKNLQSEIQMIFQDPMGSLNPRKKAWSIIAEPLFINTDLSKQVCRKRAIEMMERVGLRPELADRYPHMFSGGQRQRLGIARALINRPKILLCDEPVSALDVSIQAQILNLLMDLQRDFNLSYLFISHDLSVVRHIADQVMIMYLGKIVEEGPRDLIFNSPQHPYTKALLESHPHLNGELSEHSALQGELPSPLRPPTGCTFHPRCPVAHSSCAQNAPELSRFQGRRVSCTPLTQNKNAQ